MSPTWVDAGAAYGTGKKVHAGAPNGEALFRLVTKPQRTSIFGSGRTSWRNRNMCQSISHRSSFSAFFFSKYGNVLNKTKAYEHWCNLNNHGCAHHISVFNIKTSHKKIVGTRSSKRQTFYDQKFIYFSASHKFDCLNHAYDAVGWLRTHKIMAKLWFKLREKRVRESRPHTSHIDSFVCRMWAICGKQEIEHENQKIMNIMNTTFHFKNFTHIRTFLLIAMNTAFSFSTPPSLESGLMHLIFLWNVLKCYEGKFEEIVSNVTIKTLKLHPSVIDKM